MRRTASASGGKLPSNPAATFMRRKIPASGAFAEAVARAVQEGRLLYHDAFDLTGLRDAAFDRYIARLEAPAGR